MTAIVYTDASFKYPDKVAASGHIILINGVMVKHQVHLLEISNSHCAEIYAVTTAIQEAFLIKGVKQIFVNTDHQAIITRKYKRPKYQDLDDAIEKSWQAGIPVTINHVRGHAENRYNIFIDKSCGDMLKKYLNEVKSKEIKPGPSSTRA